MRSKIMLKKNFIENSTNSSEPFGVVRTVRAVRFKSVCPNSYVQFV